LRRCGCRLLHVLAPVEASACMTSSHVCCARDCFLCDLFARMSRAMVLSD